MYYHLILSYISRNVGDSNLSLDAFEENFSIFGPFPPSFGFPPQGTHIPQKPCELSEKHLLWMKRSVNDPSFIDVIACRQSWQNW